MPKPRRDPLGLQGSGIESLGKIAEPESYRGLNNFANSLFGKRSKNTPKPTAMNRRQVVKSAADLGYDVTKDGRFVKKEVSKKQTKKGMGGHAGY